MSSCSHELEPSYLTWNDDHGRSLQAAAWHDVLSTDEMNKVLAPEAVNQSP